MNFVKKFPTNIRGLAFEYWKLYGDETEGPFINYDARTNGMGIRTLCDGIVDYVTGNEKVLF